MAEVRFDDRVIIVTGAGQGLGRAYVEALAQRGAALVVNDLGGSPSGGGGDPGVAESLAAELQARGVRAVANTDSVLDGARIVEQAMDAFGRVDGVVNNAGVLRDQAFHKMSDEDWDAVVGVHLRGAFAVTRAAWPVMRAQGYGRIVMTASGAGVYGNFGQANYSAAKLGLYGFARSLAVEGAAKDIHVNTIAPVAASRLTAGVMPPQMLEVLKPEAVAPLVLWLLSEACEATGQLFEVGGGVIARLRWERSAGAGFAPDSGFTPEDVAAAWSRIQDFAAGDHPDNVADSFAPIARNTGVDLNLSRQ